MSFNEPRASGLSLADSGASDGPIQTLARGLAVIRAFGPGRERMTMAEVASATELTRPAIRRILLTLNRLGYVGIDGRLFYLTSHVTELGRRYLAQSLWQETRPELEKVARELNETTSAGVLDGCDLVYTVRVPSSRPVQYELAPGSHLPAHSSSMGQVLLAALSPVGLASYLRQATFETFTPKTISNSSDLRRRLDEVRAQGWVWSRGEIDEDNDGISVPVTDGEGKTLAALAINIDIQRATREFVEGKVVPRLREAATKIAAQL